MYLKGINPFKMLSKDPALFWSFFVTSFIRAAYTKLTGKKLRLTHYGGGLVLPHEQTNDILKKAIIENKPYFMGRHGTNEIHIALHALLSLKGYKEMNLDTVRKHEGCGFICNNKEDVYNFLEEMKFASSHVDMYGCLRGIFEDYFIKIYMPKDIVLAHTNMLDFWRYEVPFTSALKGKKVLVVHPFENTIKEQYKKRELLFSNPNVLPEFELKTLKSVQTIAGNIDERFNNWFDALDYMYNEAMKIDFNVAILGCGAYGMPLSARLKQAGKTVIYMGGVTQMLFGIKGNRWDRDLVASKLYNEYWVRPSAQDKPKNADKVEDGCYW